MSPPTRRGPGDDLARDLGNASSTTYQSDRRKFTARSQRFPIYTYPRSLWAVLVSGSVGTRRPVPVLRS